MADVVISRKKHKILLDDNYRFQMDRVYKNKTYWKCVEYKSGCKARIHTVDGKLLLFYFMCNLVATKQKLAIRNNMLVILHEL